MAVAEQTQTDRQTDQSINQSINRWGGEGEMTTKSMHESTEKMKNSASITIEGSNTGFRSGGNRRGGGGGGALGQGIGPPLDLLLDVKLLR